MVAIITGDIINSRQVDPNEWQPRLKSFLEDRIRDASKWEIYRGDSFQIEVEVEDALSVICLIKALIRQVDELNVRMSIGIGDKNYQGAKVTESYGQAFINSGEAFEQLKNRTLSLKTSNSEFDAYFNPILNLISFVTDQWKPKTAKAFFYALYDIDSRQQDIALKMNIDRTTINRALKRAAFEEINEIIQLYSKKVRVCLT